MRTKRILAWLLTLTMLMTIVPSFGIIAAAEESSSNPSLLQDEVTEISSDTKENTNQAGGIIYTKTSTAKSDGTIDITLTAHTTGEVRQLTSVTPTDIVLVLDVSGSMNDPSDSFSVYEEVLGSSYTYWQGSSRRTGYGFSDQNTYYINTGTEENPVYTGVSRTGRDNNRYDYFEYSRGNNRVYVYPELRSGTATNRSYNYPVYQFYSLEIEEADTSRIQVLKDAVYSFIDTTATMNEGLEADEMHTISIVKFAGERYSNNTTDTPVITEGDETYIDRYEYNYSQVVKGLTAVDATGAAALKAAVDDLSPAGSTAVDKGLALAEAVLMNRSQVGGDSAVDRNEVVIVFTDGEPNYSSGFEDYVANRAIATAGNMEKTAGVTVYGVCIAPNADATDLDENMNKFMHYVSSNYPGATSMGSDEEDCDISAGYYMTPDDSTTLTMIFESIIQDIDHPTITMGEEATMVDTISPYFDFQGTVNDVKLQTSARNSDGTWADPVDDRTLVANITNDRLTVYGFDFDANYVSETGRGADGDFYGKRLVVSFTVVPNYDVIDRASATLMDGILYTNSGFATLEDSDSAPAAQVPTPELPTHKVTYMVGEDEYATYNRFTGSDVKVDAEPTKLGYTFSGWTIVGEEVDPGDTFKMPDEDVEIRGTFTPNPYNVKYLLDGIQLSEADLPDDASYECDSIVSVEDDIYVPGYTFSGWITDDVAVSDDKEFTMPAHEVIFYGSFEAAAVDYKVEYYFENIEGTTDPTNVNDYTINEKESYTRQGLFKTTARAELKTFTGYTLNRELPETKISGEVTVNERGEGDLVLRLYYKLNRHNVTYSYVGDEDRNATPSVDDLKDENLTDVKYGTVIKVIPEPTLPEDSSYSFAGWSADNVPGIAAEGTFTMPDADVNIKGSFYVSGDAEYKVEHYLEDEHGDFVHYAQSDVTLYTTPDTDAYIRLANAFQFEGYELADKTVFEDNYSEQTYNETEYRLEQLIEDSNPIEVFKIYYVRKEYPVTYEFVGLPDVDDEDIPTLPARKEYAFGSEVSVDKTEISIPGYTFSGWDTEDATVAGGEFVMPAKPVVLRGRFSPALANWQEQHYLQNADDPSKYDLDDTPTGNIPHSNMTGTNVTVNAGHYPGFELNKDETNAMNDQNGLDPLDGNNAVTAEVLYDGSLVIKFYYDRNLHDVTYVYEGIVPEGAPDLDGENYNENPANDDVPFGKEVVVAATPEVPGYTFSGWTTTDADIVNGEFDMPDRNVTLKGNFTANKVTYQVKYWHQNLDAGETFNPEEYTLKEEYTFGDDEDEEAYTGQHVDAIVKTYTGFSLNTSESKTFDHVTVDEDGVGNLVLNLYYDRHTYDVIYGYYGEQPEGTEGLLPGGMQNVRYGTPNIPVEGKLTLEGYSFDGWYTRTATVADNKFTMPDQDVTFLGRFIAQYTVSYDLNGGAGASGVSYDDEIVTSGTVIGLKAVPTRTDYVFTGWSDTTNTYQPDDEFTVNADVTFTAQWEEDVIGVPDPDDGDGVPDIYQKKITFKIENGKWSDGSSADIVKVVDLKDEHDNYSSSGTANITAIIPTGMTADTGFKNGAWLAEPPTVVSGTDAVTYTYTFARSTTPIDPSNKVLYFVEHYKVNEDGTYPADPTESEMLQGTIGEDATATPKVYDGYALDENISHMTQKLVKIESDADIVTLKLYYDVDVIGVPDPDDGDGVPDIYQKKITFKIENGKWSDGTSADIVKVVDLKDEHDSYSSSGTANITAIIPTGMTANTGYRSGAWDTTPPEIVSGTDEATYTYSYERSGGGGGGGTTRYTLTYETNGGNEIAKETYNSGATAKLTKVPVKDGYVFEGWHLDEALTEDVTEVKMTKNITVYAAWVEDNGNAGNGHETPGSLNGEDHFAYVVGYPDGTVRPNDNISRAEVTSIFFRLLKPDEVRDKNLTDENDFADVNTADWYNTAISTMAKLGIVNGRTEESFVPNAFITRAEFAAICARFDDSEYEIVDNFTDVNDHWAENEIHEAAAHGWIRGYEDGTFKPDQFITRAEAMTMINRVLNRVPETADDLLADMVNWPDNSDKSAWYYLAVQEATNSHDYEMKNHIYEKWTALREVTDWTKYE